MSVDIAYAWGNYNSNGSSFSATPQLIENVGTGGAPAPLGAVQQLDAEAAWCHWLIGGVPYALGTNFSTSVTGTVLTQDTSTNSYPYGAAPSVMTASVAGASVSWSGYGVTLPIIALDGGDHNMAIVDNVGKVFSWGNGTSGSLGQGSGVTYTNAVPGAVLGIGGTGTLTLSTASSKVISGGGSHYLGITASGGNVVAWGDNSVGECGQGSIATTSYPYPVEVLSGAQGLGTYLENIVAVSAGQAHCLALDSSGKVWAWGMDQFGQLGDGTYGSTTGSGSANGTLDGGGFWSAPVAVETPWATAIPGTTIVAISAGGGGNSNGASFFLDSNGKGWACGYNGTGGLGLGVTGTPNTTTYNIPQPIQLSAAGLSGTVTQLSCGAQHGVAVSSTNQFFVWGDNSLGELGIPALGAYTSIPTPLIVGPGGTINKAWAGNRCTTVSMSITAQTPLPGSRMRGPGLMVA